MDVRNSSEKKMPELLINTLASFTSPMDISVTPYTLLWILPLLIVVSVVYKATKLRVIIWRKLLRETLILLLTTSLFMAFSAIAVWTFIQVVL